MVVVRDGEQGMARNDAERSERVPCLVRGVWGVDYHTTNKEDHIDIH